MASESTGNMVAVNQPTQLANMALCRMFCDKNPSSISVQGFKGKKRDFPNVVLGRKIIC